MPDAAAACTGTDENKAFFADAAKAVDWTVVCAVLPNGLVRVRGLVPPGQAAAGSTISYKGPQRRDAVAVARARGAPNPAGVRPTGTELGPAGSARWTGRCSRLADGGFAIAVDQGEAVSWLFETSGLGQA